MLKRKPQKLVFYSKSRSISQKQKIVVESKIESGSPFRGPCPCIYTSIICLKALSLYIHFNDMLKGSVLGISCNSNFPQERATKDSLSNSQNLLSLIHSLCYIPFSRLWRQHMWYLPWHYNIPQRLLTTISFENMILSKAWFFICTMMK